MAYASRLTRALVEMAEALSEHEAMTLDALSARALGKGGFFGGLKAGRDCRTATAIRVLDWFKAVWPDDLPLPESAPRVALTVDPLKGAFTPARDKSGAHAMPEPDDEFLARLSHQDIWANGHRPPWWEDMEVRAFLTRSHRQMSLLRAAQTGARKFGARCPKKSAIHTYWQRLDKLHGRVA